MYSHIDKSKSAIKSHGVFHGLAVDDRPKYAQLFMQPQFKLVEFVHELGAHLGWIIFEEWKGCFVFHLVNFTRIKTNAMTERVMREFVKPYCEKNGLKFIQASAERRGMAIKLEKLGLKPFSGQVLRGEAAHVL